MRHSTVKHILIGAILLSSIGKPGYGQQKGAVQVIEQFGRSPREIFGIQKIKEALRQAGYSIGTYPPGPDEKKIFIGNYLYFLMNDPNLGDPGIASAVKNLGPEGFVIHSDGQTIYVSGKDPSGILYGCLELADRIKATKKIQAFFIADQPEMVMRGACIGLQKPYYLPGRSVYEYPYTPQTFPWFYDKKGWIQYLDSLVENRMNSLYLWNGHPFASLVKLDKYPYAVEVDDVTFKMNEEMYSFITHEADKRGIWVIQMFYNIIVSKPFAEKNGLKTQDRSRPIIPIIADYTKKSITAFVQKYPNVGLMVCLGEAMEGNETDVEWFTKTIIPGVLQGLRNLGKTEQPPIVLRAHDTDAPMVMKAALPLYKNLYTEAKFNGEALTYPTPRGTWAELHRTLAGLGGVQIENVHILANLEPFRYGAVDFIQQSVKGMHEAMNGNGLHLYPQASYWDWPYSADSIKGKRLLQIERDWIWYRAWARYAWKAGRNRGEEINYWSNLLAAKYGCNKEQGRVILEAYEQSGEIAPRLLRRFGITDGNRQTLTLGMLMTQLINPYRYGLFTLLYDSESPPGEMLGEYAEKEWKKEKHTGETPVDVINEVKVHGERSVKAIDLAASGITKNKEEFNRLKNDIYCYRALARHFAQKAEAALHILRYKYTNDIKDLESALPLLQQSIDSYKELVTLTNGTYLYANSMQTAQRKIPMRGVDGTFKKWWEMVKPFENELANFRHNIDSLKHPVPGGTAGIRLLENAKATVNMPVDLYTIDSGNITWVDSGARILAFAKELKGLKGLQLSANQQIAEGTNFTFSSDRPVKILVGYFKPKRAAFKATVFAKAPELETNAHANNYGEADIKIANAIVLKGMPPVNIHSYSFNAGTNTLKLPKGLLLILGFVNGIQEIPSYDAGLTEDGTSLEIDWLFE